jgi:hypothetical protein
MRVMIEGIERYFHATLPYQPGTFALYWLEHHWANVFGLFRLGYDHTELPLCCETTTG